MAAGSNPLSHVIQHPIKTVAAELGPLTPNGEITLMSDHIAMIIAAGLLLSLFLPPMFKRRREADDLEGLVPRGFANGLEAICQYLRKEVAEPALGEHTDRFIKYIWSVFFFILTMNLLGLVPLPPISELAFHLPIGGTATSNIWVTGTLAITTLFMMVFNGIRIGGRQFVAHLCPGPLWLAPILVPVELLGFLAKTFALAVRLFANMVAGHTLLAVLLGFILSAGSAAGAGMGFAVAVPVVLGSVAISMLEIFVAFLQAFIFTFLTTLFIGMSIEVHDAAHHEEAQVQP
jgi:F-type H+-transporting ATPase subunit a